jgi:hypothetical protein
VLIVERDSAAACGAVESMEDQTVHPPAPTTIRVTNATYMAVVNIFRTARLPAIT